MIIIGGVIGVGGSEGEGGKEEGEFFGTLSVAVLFVGTAAVQRGVVRFGVVFGRDLVGFEEASLVVVRFEGGGEEEDPVRHSREGLRVGARNDFEQTAEAAEHR